VSKLQSAVDAYRAGGLRGLASETWSFLGRGAGAVRRELKARRVRRAKQSMDEREAAYTHDPRVSFLVQWFNQRGNVGTVAPRLPDGPDYETVVCEDGSVDGSLAAWHDRLTRRNDFLVRSNDLHEIRAYTRAIGLSRGEYVCLMQDDDEPPDDAAWVDASLALFEQYPDLAVLCGQSAWGMQDLDDGYRYEPGEDPASERSDIPDATEADIHPEIDDWLREGGGYKDERPEEIPTVDPATGRPFVFTPCISVGPVFVRRSVFEALGGFDFGFSEPGEPGMGFEVDFALRCWEAGYRVGFTPMGFERGEVGGTKAYAPEARDRAHEEAWAKLRADYRDRFDEVSARVYAASADLAARE
jgi:glycosyltransferase involved in cell wall biosynthesis